MSSDRLLSELPETCATLKAELDRRTAVTPAMLHSIDGSGRLISVSDAWLAKLGYAREEVLGRRSSEFLTAESRERAIKEVLPAFFRDGHCENVEYQMVCKDGRIIDVLLSAVLELDPSRNERVSLAVITDVTALKDAKRRLAESEARYRGLVEDQSEYLSLATPDGVWGFVNQAYASIYGKAPDAMVGANLFDFIPADERAAVERSFAAACQTEGGVKGRNQIVLPSGERRWTAWTNRALRDAEGRVTAIHSVGRDIEDMVRAERRLQESEARYRGLVEDQSEYLSLATPDGVWRFVNRAFASIFGKTPEEMIGKNLFDHVAPEARSAVEQRLAATCRAHEPVKGRSQIVLPSGERRWTAWTNRALRDAEGRVTAIHSVGRDIEDRVRAERLLQESEARYRLLAENSSDMVFQLDADLARRYVSPACREILGYEPQEMIGVKPVDMAHPEDAGRLALVFDTLLGGRAELQSIINRVRHRDGRWIWVEARLRSLKDPQSGAPNGVIGALRDISARKAVEDELAEANRRLLALAGEDGLTGLYNRRAFDEAFVREYRRAVRGKTRLALIMLDVDRFKAFNDRYGHPLGDECLRRVGATIRGAMRRPGDLVARYGGEEFVVLLPDTDEAAAAEMAERIRRAVLDLSIAHADAGDGIVSVSAGVAAIGPHEAGRTPAALLEAADRALYAAKSGGRNLVMKASMGSALSDDRARA